jgi:hypothetical protein
MIRSSRAPTLPGTCWVLFMQDNWTVSPNLTLQYGLRFETFSTSDEPLRNPLFEQTFGFSNTGTMDGETFCSRASASTGSPMTSITRPVTRWFRSVPWSQPGRVDHQPVLQPGWHHRCVPVRLSLGGSTDCTDLDPNFMINPDPNQQPRLGGVTPAQDVDVVADGFNLPSEWKANLAWDMELPGIERSNLTLEVGKTWVKDSMYWTDENLGAVQGTLPDGRNHYWADPNTGSGARTGARSGLQQRHHDAQHFQG